MENLDRVEMLIRGEPIPTSFVSFGLISLKKTPPWMPIVIVVMCDGAPLASSMRLRHEVCEDPREGSSGCFIVR